MFHNLDNGGSVKAFQPFVPVHERAMNQLEPVCLHRRQAVHLEPTLGHFERADRDIQSHDFVKLLVLDQFADQLAFTTAEVENPLGPACSQRSQVGSETLFVEADGLFQNLLGLLFGLIVLLAFFRLLFLNEAGQRHPILRQQEVLIGILAPDHAHGVHVEQQAGRTSLGTDFWVIDVDFAEAHVERLESLRVLMKEEAQVIRRLMSRRDRQQHASCLGRQWGASDTVYSIKLFGVGQSSFKSGPRKQRPQTTTARSSLRRHGLFSFLLLLFQSRNATFRIAFDWPSVFIKTRCQPCSVIVAWSA